MLTQGFATHGRRFLVIGLVVASGYGVGLRQGQAEAQPAGPAPVSGFAPDVVVATIDGRELTLGDLMVRYATAPEAQRQRYESTGRGLRGFLDDTLANMAVASAARDLGSEDDPFFEVLLEIHREDVLRDLYARRTVLAEIDEPSLRARYEEQRSSRFERQPRIRLRQILVTHAVGREKALEKARELRREIDPKGADFADLARRYSEDASAAEGGDLGWAAPAELVPELAKAAFALDPGEVSGVVESPLGFHILEVVDLRRGGVVPFELVRELLYQEMVGERGPLFARRAQEDRAARLAEREVVTYPERLPW